jgi:lipopolysaccharide transport system permease protein
MPTAADERVTGDVRLLAQAGGDGIGTAAANAAPSEHETVIEARPGWVAVNWREMVEFRELLYFLVLRDLKVRYKQTVLGASWAVLSPLMSMVVNTFVFGTIAGITTDGGVPYWLFSFTGNVPWAMFTTSLNVSANSLVGNSYLIKKIYFPRLYIPLSGVIVALVDFAVAFVVLLAMMMACGYVPTWRVMWLPVFTLIGLTAAVGAGLWLAALMVVFRDVRNLIGWGVQAWGFASPIVYPRSVIAKKFPAIAWVYDLNPVTPMVEGTRWALLGPGKAPDPTPMILAGAGMALLLLVSGLYFFRRMEKTFADIS